MPDVFLKSYQNLAKLTSRPLKYTSAINYSPPISTQPFHFSSSILNPIFVVLKGEVYLEKYFHIIQPYLA